MIALSPELTLVTPRLRTSLVVLVVAALAPVFALVIYISIQGQNAGLRSAEHELLVATRLAALGKERSVEGARHFVDAIASTPSIRRSDREQCARYFENLSGRLTSYSNAGVLDLDGNVLCQVARVERPANLADRGYFKEVLSKRAFVVGTYTLGRMTGRAALIFAGPVYDLSRNLVGVAFVALDLQVMADEKPVDVPPGMRVVITDRENVVVAGDGSQSPLLGKLFSEVAPATRTAASTGLVFEQPGPDGRPGLYATAPVGDAASSGLYVTTSIAKDAVLAEARDQLALSLALLTLLTGAGVAGARWIGARTIVAPMRKLVHQVNELGRTDSTEGAAGRSIVLPDTNNELVELSDAFQRLSEALQERKRERDHAAAALRFQIEEQLVTQTKLTSTVHKLTEAQRLAHLGSWELSLADGSAAWSDEFKRIFGIDGSDITPTYDAFLALVHPEDRAGMDAAHKSAIQNVAPLDHEHRIIRQGGTIGYVRERGEPVLGEDGVPAILTGTALDITDLRGAQFQAEAASELLSVAHRVADMGSWEMDVANNRLRFSPEACHLFGIDPQAFDGRYETYLAAIVPEDRPLILLSQEQGIAQKKMQDVEYRIRRPDGEVRWMLERGNLTFDKHGNELRRTGMVMDVTERKHSQAALQKLNAELEDRVRLRTSQLQALIEELEAFSYSVSHDLRSPLNAIDGFSHLLGQVDDERLSDKGKHYLGRIRANAKNMGQLIEGLLQLARSASDPLKREDVDLAQIARRVEQECRDKEPDRNVEVRIPPLLMARGDLLLLSVVMHNLVTNAWKFTARRADAWIEVGSHEDADGSTVYFVKDNGAGFDMSHAGKLFGTFERLHSPSEFTGTGVGLAIVKRVIKRHEGRVWAEGEEGKGASFYFMLPRAGDELPG